MSHKATTWAWEQTGLPPLCKLVLMAMADAAGDTGKTYSAAKTVCDMTGILKEDTVRGIQEKLIEYGLIMDTGRRVGDTMRIRVFQLPLAACKKPAEEYPAPWGIKPAAEAETNPPLIPHESPANPPSGGAAYIKELGTGNGEPATAATPPSLSAKARELIDYWNSKTVLCHVNAVTNGRRKSLDARLKETYFLANWQVAIDKVAASSFCRGERPGHDGRLWKANIEFFLRPDSIAKVMEGKYDDAPIATAAPNGVKRPHSYDPESPVL